LAGLFALVTPEGAPAAIQFTDVSAAAGVGADAYDSTTRHSLGVNWIDFNDDDWPDLFLVNGRDLTAHLYENDGDGTFTNRDAWLPVLPNMDMSQSLFADYDNDGDLDLYIWTDHTFLSFQVPNPPDGPPNVLLKNLWVENGGVPSSPLFVDVAAVAHVQDLSFPPVGPQPGLRAKSGAWLDYDRDGDQDLFIGHMVIGAGGNIANANRLYRNEGDGTFVHATIASGIDPMNDPAKWRPTLAVIGAHLNQDPSGRTSTCPTSPILRRTATTSCSSTTATARSPTSPCQRPCRASATTPRRTWASTSPTSTWTATGTSTSRTSTTPRSTRSRSATCCTWATATARSRTTAPRPRGSPRTTPGV
jgi:hypothetical protein